MTCRSCSCDAVYSESLRSAERNCHDSRLRNCSLSQLLSRSVCALVVKVEAEYLACLVKYLFKLGICLNKRNAHACVL